MYFVGSLNEIKMLSKAGFKLCYLQNAPSLGLILTHQTKRQLRKMNAKKSSRVCNLNAITNFVKTKRETRSAFLKPPYGEANDEMRAV